MALMLMQGNNKIKLEEIKVISKPDKQKAEAYYLVIVILLIDRT